MHCPTILKHVDCRPDTEVVVCVLAYSGNTSL